MPNVPGYMKRIQEERGSYPAPMPASCGSVAGGPRINVGVYQAYDDNGDPIAGQVDLYLPTLTTTYIWELDPDLGVENGGTYTITIRNIYLGQRLLNGGSVGFHGCSHFLYTLRLINNSNVDIDVTAIDGVTTNPTVLYPDSSVVGGATITPDVYGMILAKLDVISGKPNHTMLTTGVYG